MIYDTSAALRMAIERRLLTQAEATGVAVDRLRRRVIFERIVTRLLVAEPGCWVLKGGMALEVRLGDRARLTKDIDLGLRDQIIDGEGLRDRLIEALADDAEGDGFAFSAQRSQPMARDSDGHLTWRVAIEAQLAGRPFAAVKVDVSPRPHELEATETLPLPNSLAFADLTTPAVEVIDVHRHGAEKLHAMVKDFGDRENSRVRDLVDLMLLTGHGLLHIDLLAQAVRQVWTEREDKPPPKPLPPLPPGWRLPYERMAEEHQVEPLSFTAAVSRATELWAEMFTTEEG